MLKYYLWAIGEKTLSYVPFGRPIYNGLGYLTTRTSKRRHVGCATSYHLVRKARELTPAAGTILDFGTAWHHHDAFLLYLMGDYKIYLFDVQDRAWLSYIKTYLEYLTENLDVVARELDIDPTVARRKLANLIRLKSREDIYKTCNFTSIVTDVTDKPFLPEGSLDFVVGNCVLSHIPPKILDPELLVLRAMLKDSGYMCMMIGHDDHWAFHDHSVNQFNYYRYSDSYYQAIFDTKFEYQNRLAAPEWPAIFERARLEIVDYHANITDGSREQACALPHIARRFAKYPLEELAVIHSYFLLRRMPDDRCPADTHSVGQD